MASDAELFDITVPDAERTLGGVKDDIEPDHPSVIVHMVKSLMPGQDLTRVTIPSFFLEPRSLLERMSDLFMHPDLLLAAPVVEDPLERFLAVVRWYVSGWHYKTLGVKKPYNPIIGETFAAVWQHEDGSRSQYIAEQVEHRPPISAIYFENKDRHVAITAHIWTRSQFSAPQTTKSILDGAGRLAFTNRPGEEYWITLPTYYAHNLLLGTLRMEVGDTVTLLCAKTGYRADIEFTQMTMFSSEPLNGLKAKVSKVVGKDGKSAGEVVATISGKWDAVMNIERGGKKELFLDIGATPVAPKRVLPVSAQGPWESRRLWQPATEELCKRPTVDWAVVDREKGQLEEEQRLLAVHAHKPGQAGYADWPTKLFHKKSVTDPLTGKTSDHYEWDGWAASKTAGPSTLNVLALSRSLPDSRGGWKGAGAVEAVEKATRSIKMSTKRQADFARQDNEKASS